MRMRRFEKWVLACLLLLPCAPAFADQAQRHDEQAHAHFARGAEFARQGNYEAAVTEFDAAYRSSPHPSVLYNLAQAYIGLGRPVEAARTLELYLSAWEGSLDAQRKQRAAELIALQRARIGRIAFIAPDGAHITVDGRDVGAAPSSKPLEIATGKHGIAVSLPRHVPYIASVDVHAAETLTVDARLVPVPEIVRPAQLRAPCDVPAVEVRLDGLSIGETPWQAPKLVDAGQHQIEFIRFGYATRVQTLSLGAGALTDVPCKLLPDPQTRAHWGRLSFRVTHGATVLVDGIKSQGGLMPPGVHSVTISKPGFERFEKTLRVAPRSSADVAVTLEPTPEYRKLRDSAGRRWKNWSLGAGATGLALVAAGTIVYVVNTNRMHDWESKREALDTQLAQGTTVELLRQDRALWQQSNRLQRTDDIALAMGISGLGTLGIAALLWWAGASEFDAL